MEALAPSLLERDIGRYFVGGKPHEFMVTMYRFLEEPAKRVPAVCHVDGTTRPQTVARQQNKNWHDLIEAFEESTGEGVLINTSFNLGGEPLVETPIDALRSFEGGGLDGAYLQGWLITREA